MIECMVEKQCDPHERWPFITIVRIKAPLTQENLEKLSFIKIATYDVAQGSDVKTWIIEEEETKTVWLVLKIGGASWNDVLVQYLLKLVDESAPHLNARK